jgi:transcriptional regulator with XRE-family HTH domain
VSLGPDPTEKPPVGIRARLIQLRLLAGLTQSDFARACGISRPYIGLIEAGSRKDIGVSKLAAIAVTCGVTTDYLVLGPGDEKQKGPTEHAVKAAVARAESDRGAWLKKLEAVLGEKPKPEPHHPRTRPRRRAPVRAKHLHPKPTNEARPS